MRYFLCVLMVAAFAAGMAQEVILKNNLTIASSSFIKADEVHIQNLSIKKDMSIVAKVVRLKGNAIKLLEDGARLKINVKELILESDIEFDDSNKNDIKVEISYQVLKTSSKELEINFKSDQNLFDFKQSKF